MSLKLTQAQENKSEGKPLAISKQVQTTERWDLTKKSCITTIENTHQHNIEIYRLKNFRTFIKINRTKEEIVTIRWRIFVGICKDDELVVRFLANWTTSLRIQRSEHHNNWIVARF